MPRCDLAYPEEHMDPLKCLGEGEKHYPMTCYGDEPPFFYACRNCWDAYATHWEEQWNEYYSSVMGGGWYIR